MLKDVRGMQFTVKTAYPVWSLCLEDNNRIFDHRFILMLTLITCTKSPEISNHLVFAC